MKTDNDHRTNFRNKVSNIILAVIVCSITWFTVAVLTAAFFRGVEISSTLISCWFSFWGAELLALAGIKISKVAKGGAASSPQPKTEDEKNE